MWFADLEMQPRSLAECRALLALDELDKANSFCFPADLQRYTAGAATLRFLLSHISTHNRALFFAYGN